MDKFREFQGQNLDECIKQAMEWFACPRENLEVDILQDAKSGIFGIVGARKAKIRARRAHVAEAVRTILESAGQETKTRHTEAIPEVEEPVSKHSRETQNENRLRKKQLAKSEAAGTPPLPDKHSPASDRECTPVEVELGYSLDDEDEGQDAPLDLLDKDKLAQAAREIVGNLARPIAGRDVTMTVDLEHGRPRIKIEWEGDAGLLIGREGMTLVALQYLASRILSRVMGVTLRLQLDIGEYRSRQDDKLRELAKALADKARKTGRPFSTRPLSSYHRRVIHLCLQDYEDIQTRSAGEGAMKRVLISPRRM